MQKKLEPNFTPRIFNNIDHAEFVGMWDGKEYPIKAGESKHLPAFLVEAFVGQLTDKILLRDSRNSFGDVVKRQEIKDKIMNSSLEVESRYEETSFTAPKSPAAEEEPEEEKVEVTKETKAPELEDGVSGVMGEGLPPLPEKKSTSKVATTSKLTPKVTGVAGFEGKPK